LRQIKSPAQVLASFNKMAAFLYRCPRTGFNVQGWVADGDEALGEAIYEPVTCAACAGVHLVNPNNGRVLGTDED